MAANEPVFLPLAVRLYSFGSEKPVSERPSWQSAQRVKRFFDTLKHSLRAVLFASSVMQALCREPGTPPHPRRRALRCRGRFRPQAQCLLWRSAPPSRASIVRRPNRKSRTARRPCPLARFRMQQTSARIHPPRAPHRPVPNNRTPVRRIPQPGSRQNRPPVLAPQQQKPQPLFLQAPVQSANRCAKPRTVVAGV